MLEQILDNTYANNAQRLEAVRRLVTSVENSKGNKTCLLEANSLVNLEKDSTEVKENSPYILLFGKKSLSLPYGQTSIGRAKDNQIVIDNTYVSRHHCVIVVHSDNRVEIFESSTNGILVNDEEITAHALLKTGDKIRIAPQSCNFTITLSEEKEVPATLVSQELSTYVPNTIKPTNSSASNVAGFSLIELLIVILIMGVLSTIAIANITSSRRAANSVSAIQALRVISSSEASYFSGVGNGQYGTPEDLLKEQYIDNSLAAAMLPTPKNIKQQPKSGYLFTFQIVATDPASNTMANYEISGRPLLGSGLARAGDKSFFVDSSGIIKFSPSPVSPFADVNSQPIN